MLTVSATPFSTSKLSSVKVNNVGKIPVIPSAYTSNLPHKRSSNGVKSLSVTPRPQYVIREIKLVGLRLTYNMNPATILNEYSEISHFSHTVSVAILLLFSTIDMSYLIMKHNWLPF